jgi:hypothetical protein
MREDEMCSLVSSSLTIMQVIFICLPIQFTKPSVGLSEETNATKSTSSNIPPAPLVADIFATSQKWNLGCNRFLEVYGFDSCHNWFQPVMTVLMGRDWLQPAVAMAYTIVKHLRAKT